MCAEKLNPYHDQDLDWREQLDCGTEISILESFFGNIAPLICLDLFHNSVAAVLEQSHATVLCVPSLSFKTTAHDTAARRFMSSRLMSVFVSNRHPGLDLQGADLGGCSLERARLVECNLSGANLEGANLRFAELSRGVFDRAILESSRLDYVNARASSFREANLKNARMDFSSWVRSDLSKANLEGADGDGIAFLGAKVDPNLPLLRKDTVGPPELGEVALVPQLGHAGRGLVGGVFA